MVISNTIRNTIYKYKFLFIFIILLSIIICIYTALLERGFCYKTGTFFSELEQGKLINRGIEKLLISHRPYSTHYYGSEGGFEFVVPIIPYNNITEFKKVNPNCCYFHKGEFDPSTWYPAPFSKRISGEVYGYLVLQYQTQLTSPNDIPERLKNLFPFKSESEELYSVSVCGELKEVPNWANY